MMKTLNIHEYIRQTFDIKNDAIVEKLAESSELLRLKKPQKLFSEGMPNDFVYVLVEGVMQSYFTDADNNCAISHFYWKPGSVIMGDASFKAINQNSVSALGKCCLLSFPVSIVKKLIESNFEMASLYNRLLGAAFCESVEEKKVYHFDSPQKRLQWLQKNFPGLEEIVQDKYLAQYLSITPVTMSRMRRKIRENKINGR